MSRTLTSADLLKTIQGMPMAGRCLLAYSGGRDSHVLLHALATVRPSLPGPLIAIHVDHGLQADSVLWSEHCRKVCDTLGVPLESVSLQVYPERGKSLEALARRARYDAFSRLMLSDDLLLTAHHREDQAETLLLQLLRGAGPAGLAAMPAVASFGRGHLGRPLLGYGRQAIADYAAVHNLRWIDDPSNLDTRHDRNFLRHQVMPLLRRHWPAADRTIARSAALCAEASRQLQRQAREDFVHMHEPSSESLGLGMLTALSPPRAREVLRYWIRQAGLPLPGSVLLRRILDEIPAAGRDRNPVVRWPGAEVRRYRERIFLMSPQVPFTPDAELQWRKGDRLPLPGGAGELRLLSAIGGIPLEIWLSGPVRIRFPAGPLSCRPLGRGISVSLKKLFQEKGVPPWLRSRVPLVYIGDSLAAVGDFCLCEPFRAEPEEESVRIGWIR